MSFRRILDRVFAIWVIYCGIHSVKAYKSCIRWTEVKDYNNCITEVLESLGPELARGITDFNLPPLDPYYYSNLDLKYKLPLLSVRLNVTNYKLFKATEYIVQSVDVNPYNLTLKAKVKIPNPIVQTDYSVQGKLLSLDVTGAGTFIGNHTNVILTVIANGKNLTDENNVERVALDKVRIRIQVGGVKVRMSSTTPNFKSVAKATQDLINTFSDTILQIGRPVLDEMGEYFAKDLMGAFLSAFTRREIIPNTRIGSRQ